MTLRVAVAGGGIGGLTAALCLESVGCEVHVYERAPRASLVGAGITLWSNALRVLDALGVGAAVRAQGTALSAGMLGTSRGRVLARTDFAAIGECVCLHRADLLASLLAALPAGGVTFGVEVTGFEEAEGEVRLAIDGAPDVRCDVLVGADGLRSKLRDKEAAGPRYAGYTCWRGLADVRPEALSCTVEVWGRGQRCGLVPCGERTYWFAPRNAPAGGEDPPPGARAALLEHFAGWGFDVPAVLAATPEEAILRNDIYDLAPRRAPWGTGRSTLLGDAAHATTPNLGQGGCLAIEDGAVLARHLARARDVPAALRAYEAEREPRTSMVVRRSWRIGRIGQLENPVLCSLRDVATRLTPASALVRQLESLLGWQDGSRPEGASLEGS